jgi:hypothetical protein
MNEPTDAYHREMYQLAVRIGTSWVELRRRASMIAVREFLFGTGDDALELGQMDTLDLLAQRPAWRMQCSASSAPDWPNAARTTTTVEW